MCVDVSHLVFESLSDTDDQVVDKSSDGSEGCDVLSGAMVQFNVDNILLGVREIDCQVVEILRKFACSSIRQTASFVTPDLRIPRGPSTVTSLDLIVTLTTRMESTSANFLLKK